MSHKEQPAPNDPARRFSPGRVLSALMLVLVAAGTFAAIWFFPWPTQPKRPTTDTRITPEKIQEMKRIAERQAAEERAKRERAVKEAEGK